MQSLPDLTHLSHAQKDALIQVLWQQVQALTTQMQEMQKRILHLEARLALNSTNSSKPPSSDGLNKPAPKSLRVAGKNPTGGQKGHPGRTLHRATQPDKIVVHNVPDQCQACHVTADSKLLVFSRFRNAWKVVHCSGFCLLLKNSFSRILLPSSCCFRLGRWPKSPTPHGSVCHVACSPSSRIFKSAVFLHVRTGGHRYS